MPNTVKEQVRLVRVALDIESGRVYNWMVLDREPTRFHQTNWVRIFDDPDLDWNYRRLQEWFGDRYDEVYEACTDWNLNQVPSKKT